MPRAKDNTNPILKLVAKNKDDVILRLEAGMKLMLASAVQIEAWRQARREKPDLFPHYARIKTNNTDYGEAYGIVRALECLGVGYSGACNVEDGFNLRPWFDYWMKTIEHEANCNGPDLTMDKYREEYNRLVPNFPYRSFNGRHNPKPELQWVPKVRGE